MDDTLPEVWLDPEQIHRCLLNLVTNAIDACAEMGPEEHAGEVILRSRNGGGTLEYLINDNGCGMDEETQAKVFQRFFSTKGSRGTGLGLMITKKIIDEHGGTIELQSEWKKGTRFTIRLPGTRPVRTLKTDPPSNANVQSAGAAGRRPHVSREE
jgi:signal transduction histidine kinase